MVRLTGEWIEIGNVEANVTTYRDSEASDETAYYYRVCALGQSDGPCLGYSDVDLTWIPATGGSDYTLYLPMVLNNGE
jgi:hypothetical protein